MAIEDAATAVSPPASTLVTPATATGVAFPELALKHMLLEAIHGNRTLPAFVASFLRTIVGRIRRYWLVAGVVCFEFAVRANSSAISGLAQH